ncbi:MAG: c-type cytochrome [Candidatus Binatia bacterium]
MTTMLRALVSAIALIALATGSARAADSAEVYKAQCAKCHGETGQADSPVAKTLKVPPLAGDAKVAGTAPAELAKAIKENKKHAGFVTKMADADIEAAAARAKALAGGN